MVSNADEPVPLLETSRRIKRISLTKLTAQKLISIESFGFQYRLRGRLCRLKTFPLTRIKADDMVIIITVIRTFAFP